MAQPRYFSIQDTPILRDSNNPSALRDRDAIKEALSNEVRVISLILFSLFMAAIILFCIPTIRPIEISIGSWVERFGALIGISSIAIDIRLKKMASFMSAASFRLNPELFHSLDEQYNKIPFCERISKGFAVLGALVWAYGEVALLWFNSLFL